MNDVNISKRNNVKVFGHGERVLMFAHGFGCDHNMWRFLTDRMKMDYTIVTFDYVGSGHSDLRAFDVNRYATLEGYARDITEILDHLDFKNVTVIGHSVSAMTGMLAATRVPDRITHLVMVCPTPYYMNEPGYEGGFERADLEELVDMMDKNYIGWANYLAPLVMGGNFRLAVVDELRDSFCSTDPLVAKTFARATFFSDCRELLPDCPVPTLVLQSREDPLASVRVGQYVADHLPQGSLKILDTQGHCIHMTDPELTEAGIRAFL